MTRPKNIRDIIRSLASINQTQCSPHLSPSVRHSLLMMRFGVLVIKDGFGYALVDIVREEAAKEYNASSLQAERS